MNSIYKYQNLLLSLRKKFWEFPQRVLFEAPLKPLLLVSLSLFSLASLMGQCHRSSPPAQDSPALSMDLLLTPGQVLVPLEIYNYQSLDSILGQYGVVDLYPLDSLQRKMRKPVARYVKIVRSQADPRHFAALAPHNKAHLLLQGQAVLFAVVRNPEDAPGTEFVLPEAARPNRQIFIEQVDED